MSEEKVENASIPDTMVETDSTASSVSVSSTNTLATPGNIASAVINGAGVGLLLGMLLGLAVSPVVSGVIGTLSGLLAVLLGINEKYISAVKGIRVGSFGFFCVTGILWGMHIRVNHGLLPSRTKMMEDYKKIGFNDREARDFIAYREFGLVPAGWVDSTGNTSAGNDVATNNTVADEAEDNKDLKNITTLSASNSNTKSSSRRLINANDAVKAQSGLLYSSEVDADACQDLFTANMGLTKAEVKNNFVLTKGTWAEMANEFDPLLPDDIYKQTLLSIRNCFCEGRMSGGNIKVNRTVAKVDESQSLAAIKNTFRASDKIWQKIEASISANIPGQYQKTIFLTIYKILSHD